MPQLTTSLGSSKPEADLLIRASEGHRKGGVGAFLVTETELHSNRFLSMGAVPVSFFFPTKQFELHAHNIPVVPKIIFNSE